MTEQERLELQQQFCVKTVQDMSEEDRISFTYNVLMDSYTNNYTDEDFLTEVQEYFPELITIDVKK
jgi:hypothetical protein